jgi:hypothetical protein
MTDGEAAELEHHTADVFGGPTSAGSTVLTTAEPVDVFSGPRWWWCSLCSKHRGPLPQECGLCRSGRWICCAHKQGRCDECSKADAP